MNQTKAVRLRLPVQAAVDRTATAATLVDGAAVEAQQLYCSTATGPCTHEWPFFAGTQCTYGNTPGSSQCCSAAFQSPYIRECRNPDGSWYVAEQGCGFCV
jgi:hypothetical protein